MERKPDVAAAGDQLTAEMLSVMFHPLKSFSAGSKPLELFKKEGRSLRSDRTRDFQRLSIKAHL